MKGFLKIKHVLLTILFGVLLSNPSFDSDGDGQFDGLPSFNFDASVTGVIGDGSIGVVGQDYLVAHVDDEIRGAGIASEIPFGPYIITAGLFYFYFGEYLYRFIIIFQPFI